MPSATSRYLTALRRPVPIHTLVWLRIALGLLGAGDLLGNGIYYHWYLDSYAGFTFPYYGFGWVTPLPEPWLSLFFALTPLLGIAVALGWRFRLTAPLFALSVSYLFLLEKANYLNHIYLLVWLVWLLALTPAWREWSLDVRRRPSEWSPVAPAWTVYVFPLLMGLVYFFGGVNKINYDWLIRAMPLQMWMNARASMPLLGPLLDLPVTSYVLAWGGMLLDLTVPFLLLHRRWRWVALGLLLGFHATNHLLFNIGIFPYLSLVLTSLFFSPDWPDRAVAWLAGSSAVIRRWRTGWQGRVGGLPAAPRGWQFSPGYGRPVAIGVGALILLHAALPLRNRLFVSDVNWSEAGHRYSWRMMLRSKQGRGYYRVVDRATGTSEIVQPRDSLTAKQYRKMSTHPDMILQYAHHLRDLAAREGRRVAVYGDFRVRLNGRRVQPYVDPEVDLTGVEWAWLTDQDWVLPESVE